MPPAAANRASHLPPVSTLFAAFLGYNPIQHLVGAARPGRSFPRASRPRSTGRSFFPSIITEPFRDGLHAALDFAIVASLLAAAASWVRGPHVAAPATQPRVGRRSPIAWSDGSRRPSAAAGAGWGTHEAAGGRAERAGDRRG